MQWTRLSLTRRRRSIRRGRANQDGMRTMYFAYWLVIAAGLAASIVIGLIGQ